LLKLQLFGQRKEEQETNKLTMR